MYKKNKVWQSTFSFVLLTVISFVSFLTYGEATTQQCVSCHQEQVKDWQKSHHFHSMGYADEATVLGNFNNQTLSYLGYNANFYKENDKLMISIPDDKGIGKPYQVLYFFGYEPLQQYMFDMGKGKVQLFPFAWDSRAKEDGGQRWFVLHPDADSNNLFHFSQMGQNWNYMCADCHSTDFKKNFDLKTKSYDSTFSAINVSCNACHGDPKKHLIWANNIDVNNVSGTEDNKGFSEFIGKSSPLFQRQSDGSMKSMASLQQSKQVAMCGTCHSRRSFYKDRTSPTEFLSQFQPSLLTPELYYVDGQVWDENYVWGSFTQSKMFERGVTCTNCHNPHTGKLKLKANQTCTQCHGAESFDTPKHHGHKIGSTGSQCVDCHMPTTTYMQVDERRDHGFRVPRPDLTRETGVRNACNDCHKDKTAEWAETAIKKWHPNSKYVGSDHFAQSFYAADNNFQDATTKLKAIAQDSKLPDIVRASAITRLDKVSNKEHLLFDLKSKLDDEPLKSLALITASKDVTIYQKWQLLHSLLDDNHLPIRINAARSLAILLTEPYFNNMSKRDIDRLINALDEYKQAQKYQADRGFSHTNLGSLALDLGDLKAAEKHFLTAIEIEPIYSPAYTNLAELYRQQGDEVKVQSILEDAIDKNDKVAELYFALSMSLIRTTKKDLAKSALKKATEYASTNAQYHYTYALLLQDLGQLAQAITSFEIAFNITPNDSSITYSLSKALAAQKQYARALYYANHLARLIPNNHEVDRYIKQLTLMKSLNH